MMLILSDEGYSAIESKITDLQNIVNRPQGSAGNMATIQEVRGGLYALRGLLEKHLSVEPDTVRSKD